MKGNLCGKTPFIFFIFNFTSPQSPSIVFVQQPVLLTNSSEWFTVSCVNPSFSRLLYAAHMSKNIVDHTLA
jgi:hypothetical protein